MINNKFLKFFFLLPPFFLPSFFEYPEIREHLSEKVRPGWVEMVEKAKNIIRKGKDANDQINILGDDGVPMTYHELFWKSELVDFVILQQDAFDAIDSVTPMERQEYMLDLVLSICDKQFTFDDYEQCRNFFKELINLLRQMNYSEFKSEKFDNYKQQLTNLLSNGN